MQVSQQEMKTGYAVRPLFDMNRPTNTDEFLNTCKELRAYMADYTNTSNVPSGAKGGWYAVVTKQTGKVWLAHTKNLQSTLTRFRTSGVMPKELKGLVSEGLALFLTTKDIDVDQLRFALEETNSLLHRGTRTNNGSGKLYVVTHTSGHYYLTKARTETQGEHNILTRFISRVLDLKQSFSHQTNHKLQQFVSDHAGDLLRETGFEVREVADFKNSDEAVELMNQYYIDQTNLICLNHVFDKR
ncbi:hypothetical protein PHABIO_422 [Pseudomonas phage Phabio]|uniref:Uncharacterized protein n=1 Tax=Pseudomonas phage Phabio TaxID=2006668 RepID=A0A1Y0SZ53_9CAUD|nr:hypothetical protein MZD05_gp422 [Pseudomonas phage Phabio]ARV77053.1 hypothetical protein PHABIO_422 [Pseudomonas phage Phabio]